MSTRTLLEPINKLFRRQSRSHSMATCPWGFRFDSWIFSDATRERVWKRGQERLAADGVDIVRRIVIESPLFQFLGFLSTEAEKAYLCVEVF